MIKTILNTMHCSHVMKYIYKRHFAIIVLLNSYNLPSKSKYIAYIIQ